MTDSRRRPAAFSVAPEETGEPSSRFQEAPPRRQRKPSAVSGDAMARVTPETEEALLDASKDIAEIRKLLIQALGLEVTP